MKLEKLSIGNFKSFKKVDISFNDFNIIIGSNASGKSNLVDLIRFLQDIERWGLDSAISLQGGPEYLLNLSVGKKQALSIYAKIHSSNRRRTKNLKSLHKKYRITFVEIEVFLDIKFKQKAEGHYLKKNTLVFTYDLEKQTTKDSKQYEKVGQCIITLLGKKKHIYFTIQTTGIDFDLSIDDIIPKWLISAELTPSIPLIGQPFISVFSPYDDELFSNMSLFDFTPKSIKTSSPIVGKLNLDEDASNLPVVLKNLIKDKTRKRRLVNLVADLLPFVEDLMVTETKDKSLIFEVKEKHNNSKFIASTFLSDGTIHAISLITALYFESSPIVFFEEPERNMHPFLVRKLIEHMKSHSIEKQVLATTHNTEVLRDIEPSDVLFISRDKEGFSTVQSLSDKKEVKVFLENEIGIDELYANNLLNMD